MNIGQD